ncbi:MAG: hypothetical protein A2Y15_00670 [Clostridiales bacterium GWF2_36_10]|nr:MAG: hypothetical protein A2Y15_00670 [Clostridiales bacterium GWF2_36_10]HAN21519.1 hypothetical protein [Clostridiales bacterium]
MKKISLVILSFLSLTLLFSSCKKDSEDSDNYQKGTLTATAFESEYLDLKFKLPSGYTMATEDEMVKMANQGAELIGYNSTDLSKVSIIYEMQAVSSTGYPNIIVMVEKLPLSNMKIDTYLDSVKEQLSKVTAITYNVTSTTDNEAFVGKKYSKMTATATYGTISIVQDYYARVQDGRAIAIVISYTSETSTQKEALLSAFTNFK